MIDNNDINTVSEVAQRKKLLAGKTEKPCAVRIDIDLTNGTSQTKFQILTHGNTIFIHLVLNHIK